VITAGEHTLRLRPPLTASRADLERGLDKLSEITA
jgi:4-aminobutyrate aminotransferase-like enzyme